MKSASEMFKVDATRPPTLTELPAPNRMPLGFTRKIFPLEDRLPKMAEGSAPTTRLSATELAPGCAKRTLSPAAMPKLCQLSTRLLLVCVIVVFEPLPLIEPAPPATTPPTGAACAAPAKHSITETASGLKANG